MNSVITASISNDIGQTPQMGWNSWNKFHCDDLNATVVSDTVDKIKELKLDQLGYKYVNIDDCWMSMERDEDGHIQPDTEKFPEGMKAIGDKIHKEGLLYGIYSSAGTYTCQKRPGGLGHETEDANDYASWGVDYLKYDNCFNEGVPAFDRYNAMAEALSATGRSIFYSICNWGNENVAEWGNSIANSWRTTQDIEIYLTNENQWQSLKGNFLVN
jgi:alpha-galactosidase